MLRTPLRRLTATLALLAYGGAAVVLTGLPKLGDAYTYAVALTETAWQTQPGGDLITVTRAADGSPQFTVVRDVDTLTEAVEAVREIATEDRVEAVTWDAEVRSGSPANQSAGGVTSSTFTSDPGTSDPGTSDPGTSDPTEPDTYVQRGDDAKTSIGVPDTWRKTDGQQVTVAVIDTGVASHADLAGRLLAGGRFTGSIAVLDECTDPIDARTCTQRYSTDNNGHGSHVAGIIAARPHDTRGVTGVAPSARILPVRTDFSVLGIANAVVWAAGGQVSAQQSTGGSYVDVPLNPQPAQVLNLSYQDWFNVADHKTLPIRLALDFAAQRDAVIVSASGNCGGCQTNHLVTWDEQIDSGPTSGYRISRAVRNADTSCGTFTVLAERRLTQPEHPTSRSVVVANDTTHLPPAATCYRAALYHRVEMDAQPAVHTTATDDGRNVNVVSWGPDSGAPSGLVDGRTYRVAISVYRRLDVTGDSCTDPAYDSQFSILGVTDEATYTDRSISSAFRYCYRIARFHEWLSGETVTAPATLYRSDDSRPVYPAMNPNVLTVGSLGVTGTLSASSSGGDGAPTDDSSWWLTVGGGRPNDPPSAWLDLVAPGENILSLTGTTTGYRHDSGTSMATPHVAGVAALLRSRYPQASRTEIQQIMTASATDLARDSGETGWDTYHGYGVVRADRAVALADTTFDYEPQNIPVVLHTPGQDSDEVSTTTTTTTTPPPTTVPTTTTTTPPTTVPTTTTTTTLPPVSAPPVVPPGAPVQVTASTRLAGTDVLVSVQAVSSLSLSGVYHEVTKNGQMVGRDERTIIDPGAATRSGVHSYTVRSYHSGRLVSITTVSRTVKRPTTPKLFPLVRRNGRLQLTVTTNTARPDGWFVIYRNGVEVARSKARSRTKLTVTYRAGTYSVRHHGAQGVSLPSRTRTAR